GPYVLLLTAVVLLLGRTAAAAALSPGFPAIAGVLIAFLVLALSFVLGIGSARSQLTGGLASAVALTVLSNLYLRHTYNPGSGFYEN
ncbi:MAG TPA: hypothetical protein VM490_08655, partial [Armatimonadaceae bacterium]|nr:hypothetical protein [Armatimonadaceae bacterium]